MKNCTSGYSTEDDECENTFVSQVNNKNLKAVSSTELLQ